MQSHFRVVVHDQDRACLISVSGELDLASSPELQGELERTTESDAELVIVDLRQLEFMDSTGLSVLVKAHQRAEERGQQFALVKGPPQVERLLGMTGLAERLTIVDSPEELLDADQRR